MSESRLSASPACPVRQIVRFSTRIHLTSPIPPSVCFEERLYICFLFPFLFSTFLPNWFLLPLSLLFLFIFLFSCLLFPSYNLRWMCPSNPYLLHISITHLFSPYICLPAFVFDILWDSNLSSLQRFFNNPLNSISSVRLSTFFYSRFPLSVSPFHAFRADVPPWALDTQTLLNKITNEMPSWRSSPCYHKSYYPPPPLSALLTSSVFDLFSSLHLFAFGIMFH